MSLKDNISQGIMGLDCNNCVFSVRTPILEMFIFGALHEKTANAILG